jgi:hypothetical protein
MGIGSEKNISCVSDSPARQKDCLSCSVKTCIVDTVFIPTAAAEAEQSYWSSTSIDDTRHFALTIGFINGGIGGGALRIMNVKYVQCEMVDNLLIGLLVDLTSLATLPAQGRQVHAWLP